MATKGTRSGRYTPPKPKTEKHSPLWVATTMTTALLSGVLVIVANYLSLLPGDTQNRYLFLGLGLVIVGFSMAANYR
jgi:hypothetical protein